MSKINATKKGKRYERKIAKILSKYFGIDVKRVPNSGGLDIKGDLRNLSGALENFVFECKHQEKINIWKCIEQAKTQARYRMWALIFTRNNEGSDYVVLDLNDFMTLIEKGN